MTKAKIASKGLTFLYVREPLFGGPAEAGPSSVPEEGNAALLRDVRHPDEVPFLALAGVEGVLDLPPGVHVLVQH